MPEDLISSLWRGVGGNKIGVSMVCVRVSVRKQNKQNEIKEGFLFYREEKDDGFMSIGEKKKGR